MPDVQTELEFLSNLPEYELNKPYLVLPLVGSGFNPDLDLRITNIKLETKPVTIQDMRGGDFSVAKNGFQFIHHVCNTLAVTDLTELKAHKSEMEQLLSQVFPDAERIVTWDYRARKNVKYERTSFDANDPLLVEGPAKGAHVDATLDSGPTIIDRHLPLEYKDIYFKPGYRFRLINTWRSLVPALEDRPLAVCDFQSTSPQDLLAADRVYPQRTGEVYYLLHNDAQRWWWLSNHTPDEAIVTIMYDSAPGPQARYCPHVSFHNPLASPSACPRESVETRSIVISKN